ncbi:MAG TPA: sigma-70 family RNA polymerase sigma factor [Opitutaceae bacterium]|jgi:RNA polymerase sigma factor (sigma-70 family)|nr:sigma-70 family RNA polymerase sigma factor [Opitutaceae bacterium]
MLREHSTLTREQNHELAVKFIVRQDEVSGMLAAMLYPVERMMAELKSGRQPYYREKAEKSKKGKKSQTKYSGVSPSHAEEFERQIDTFRSGQCSPGAFEGWLHGFLRGFTYEVIEAMASFAREVADDLRDPQMRVRLDQALHEAGEIRNQVIQGNLRLVLKEVNSERIRRKLRGPAQARVSEDDLFMIGVHHGLSVAVNRFNPEAGAFSTYATLWIQQAITRHIKENQYLYHIPIGLQDQLHADPDKTSGSRRGCNKHVILPSEESIHAPLGENSEASVGEVIPDDTVEMPYTTAAMSELKEMVDEGVQGMDEPTRMVLALRYGLGDPIALAKKLFLDEAAQSDRRAKATVAVAASALTEPVQLKLNEGQPVPSRLLMG